MDNETEPAAAMENHRMALRSLSRRELQARAKALGVRANGKSVDIIESVAKVLSRPGSPVKCGASENQEEDDRENVRDTGSTGARRSLADGLADEPCFSGQPKRERQDMDTEQAQTPSAAGAPHVCPTRASDGPGPTQQQLPSHMGAGSPSDASDTRLASTPGPASTATLAELAARASAAALTASLSNLRLESELKVGRLGTVRASLCKAPGSRQQVPPDGMSSSEDERSPRSGSIAESLSFDAREEATQVQIDLQRDEPSHKSAQVGAGRVDAQPARTLIFAGSNLPCCGHSASPSQQQQDGHGSPLGTDGGTPASASASQAVRDSDASLCDSRAETSARSPGHDASCAPQFLFAVPSGAATSTPTVARLAPVTARPIVCVTDRTPLRQQRLLGGQLQPSCAPAATPAGRGAVLPRTPGTGLRTPARRVPVCTDEAKERAMDEWVSQHLVTAAGANKPPVGPQWGELVGLTGAKQRLQELCTERMAPSDASSSLLGAQWRAAGAGSSSTVGSSKDTSGTRTGAGSPATGQPHAVRPSTGGTLPNAAVMVVGPAGSGKSCLARAFASKLGATYIHVPPDVARRVADVPGGTEVIMRSVARVATQTPGPVIIHVEDVDELVGTNATRQSQESKRLRAELVVAVDELLVQPLTSLSSPGQNGPSPATARSRIPSPPPSGAEGSSAVSRGRSDKLRFKVLVLSTASHPMVLDATLAASLSRTECVLVGPLGADDREAYLVGRLASVGAALGVEQVDRLVRQTQGLTCAELADLCNGAVQAAAARRAVNPAARNISLNEEDLGEALRQAGRRSSDDEIAEMERWHVRMGMAPHRRGPWCQ